MNAESIFIFCLLSISSIADAKLPEHLEAGNKQGSLTATTVSVGSPLVVSENGHYLTRPDGKPIFWFSDTEWVINKFTDEQIIKILDDRKSKGFNVIQVFAARSWDKNWWVGDQSWAQTDAYGNFPFVDGVGTGEQMKVALKSEKEIIVFYPDTNSATVVNNLNKKAKALWFDPRNGRIQKAETFNSV